jgi:hypothetical protein
MKASCTAKQRQVGGCASLPSAASLADDMLHAFLDVVMVS